MKNEAKPVPRKKLALENWCSFWKEQQNSSDGVVPLKVTQHWYNP